MKIVLISDSFEFQHKSSVQISPLSFTYTPHILHLIFPYFYNMTSSIWTPLRKRFFIAIPLGIFFGFFCVGLVSYFYQNIWGSAMMLAIVTNRFVIGVVVGLAGAYLRHPVLNFPIPAYMRGTCLGVFVSLSLAFSTLITPIIDQNPWNSFFATLIIGGIYGMIIDIIATKWGGEGKELLK